MSGKYSVPLVVVGWFCEPPVKVKAPDKNSGGVPATPIAIKPCLSRQSRQSRIKMGMYLIIFTSPAIIASRRTQSHLLSAISHTMAEALAKAAPSHLGRRSLMAKAAPTYPTHPPCYTLIWRI